jgi:molecular chaperone HtpG
LEYFRKQGYDVLFMTDPIDEWVMQSLNQYQKKNFVSITKDGFEIAGAEETVKAAAEKYATLIDYLKKELEGNVSEVRFSARLTDSPCCLITEGSALAPHMERLFRAMNQAIPESKRILELNPDHPLIAALNDMAADAENPDLKKYANVLWDQALLSEGSPIKDTAAFVKNVTELMLKGIKK